MANSYYDLLGLLIEKFGGAQFTTLILESIEAAIRNFELPRLHPYLPLIVAYFYKQHLNATIVLPSMVLLLHQMGYSSKGLIQKKQKLITLGVIPKTLNPTFFGDCLLFLEHLVSRFPLDGNPYQEAKMLATQPQLWESSRPVIAACCIHYLVAKRYHLNYKVYILADYLKISMSSVYNLIKKVEKTVGSILETPITEPLCEASLVH